MAADKQTLQSEQPLQVARCTKIINADSEDSKYIINVKQFAKFVVDLAEQVASTDIEEGMRVGVDRNKYQVRSLCLKKYTLSPGRNFMSFHFLRSSPKSGNNFGRTQFLKCLFT